MPDPTDEADSREQQLDALIAEYFLAVESGTPVDRAEFVNRHPEFAKDLQSFFGDLGQLEQIAPPMPMDETVTQDQLAPVASTTGNALPQVRYFGSYEILDELGAGGMGVVYKARQKALKKIVALKMIKRGQLASEHEVLRFQAEARAAARLDHPGIVTVHEVGVHQGQHYYAMDFVGGGSLSQLQRDEPVPISRAAELLQQLAAAMHYAHSQGIVHRDLKPANILLTTQGVPRITDFGLAKRLWFDDESRGADLTETGQILGTASYMSPEQAAGKTQLVGPLTDIYSLGAILYALLTGRAPFVGESQSDTILQVIQREPVSPRSLNPSVSRDLETICLKCLEKEPERRYSTAALLADDLQRFCTGRPVLARPLGSLERLFKLANRHPVATIGLGLMGVLVSLLLQMIATSGDLWAMLKSSPEIASLFLTIEVGVGVAGGLYSALVLRQAQKVRWTLWIVCLVVVLGGPLFLFFRILIELLAGS